MSDPTMIMLDEPMAGVNPALTQSLLGHIQTLRDEGMTVLFVEHDMHVVRHISDWVVVMAEGRIVAEGPADTVMSNPAVIDAYLGAHHDTDLGDDALLSDEALGGDGRRGRGRGGRARGREDTHDRSPTEARRTPRRRSRAATPSSRPRTSSRATCRASTSSTAAAWSPTPAR